MSASPAQTTLDPTFALQLRDHYADMIANEITITQRVIAAVPVSKQEYRPDPKARTAAELVEHIVSSDLTFLEGIAALDFSGMGSRIDGIPDTPQAAGSWYVEKMTGVLDGVRRLTPKQLCTPIDFYGAFNFPAVMYLSFLQNHSVHHRGELATYLRPMGSKVPDIYGGSADEPWQGPKS